MSQGIVNGAFSKIAALNMRERARPKVAGCLFGEPGANRVQVDISQGDAEMVAV